ncbi:hypothetical protein B9Z19DRAFT_1120597 [Tuber borchii]|uniref:Uncharacterized protein n=1 Tax=Tuber borchii TaxID=42251 RepID=A0A2T7A4C8_TUBBO|nr:hypothetical protein B9Z19DRAFT_1120597 [Tuber borchii]
MVTEDPNAVSETLLKLGDRSKEKVRENKNSTIATTTTEFPYGARIPAPWPTRSTFSETPKHCDKPHTPQSTGTIDSTRRSAQHKLTVGSAVYEVGAVVVAPTDSSHPVRPRRGEDDKGRDCLVLGTAVDYRHAILSDWMTGSMVTSATKTPKEVLKSRIAVEAKAKVEAGKGKPAKLVTNLKSPIPNFNASAGVQKGARVAKAARNPPTGQLR